MTRRASKLALAVTILALAGCKAEAQQAPTPDHDASAAGSAKAKQVAPGRATRVETAEVQPSAAQLELSRPGEVVAVRDANLGAALGGFVERVDVSSGDRVRRGQLLVTVDSATHQARRRQAKVEYDAAKRDLVRTKKAGDAIALRQLDAAQTRVAAAKAALRTLNVQVARSVVRAPFSGTIDQVHAEVGEVAAPGAPLLRLMQLDPAKIVVSISDRDVLAVREGMAATVMTDARGDTLEGVVKRVRRSADLRTRAFEAEIEIPNADEKLLPGMIATVRLRAPVVDNQLVVQNDWLVTKPDGIGVFVNEQGVARYRVVQLGAIVGNRVVIEAGLRAGDHLVITGHRELADGDALRISRHGLCCREGRVVFEKVAK